jgi:hypothetical protein
MALRSILRSIVPMVLLGAPAFAQQKTTITATNINAGGNTITGTLCFTPIDAFGNSIPISQSGGGFFKAGAAFCQNLVGGALSSSLNLPNPLTDFPQGHGYAMVTYDQNTGLYSDPIRIYSIGGSSWSLDNYQPTATVPTTPAFTFTNGGGSHPAQCTPPSIDVRVNSGVADLAICSSGSFVSVTSGSGTFTGGTITGPTAFGSTVALDADPTTSLQAATKQYVDAHSDPLRVVRVVTSSTTATATDGTIRVDPTSPGSLTITLPLLPIGQAIVLDNQSSFTDAVAVSGGANIGWSPASISPGEAVSLQVGNFGWWDLVSTNNTSTGTSVQSSVAGVTITNSGTYTSCPTGATFSGGGGTGASGFPFCSSEGGGNLIVSDFIMTADGEGYSSAPAVTFTGGAGTGGATGAAFLASGCASFDASSGVQSASVPCALYAGSYSSGTTYTQGAIVTSGGSAYISLIGSNAGNTPSSSPSDWQPLGGSSGSGSSGSILLNDSTLSGTVWQISSTNGTLSIAPGSGSGVNSVTLNDTVSGTHTLTVSDGTIQIN